MGLSYIKMFFKPVYFPKIPKLIRKNINGKRHYVDPTGSILDVKVALPSVTNVLSILSEVGLRVWRSRVGEAEAKRVSGRALANGNEFHLIIENYLKNMSTESFKNETSLKLFEQAKPELSKINNIRAQEVHLYSTKLGVAGTADCIADYNGVLSVIDFKSAKKKKQKSWIKSYFLQGTAYALMVEELTKCKVDQIVILISAEDGTVQAYVEDKNQFIPLLEDVIADYMGRNDVQ